jgi:hypothetical protein
VSEKAAFEAITRHALEVKTSAIDTLMFINVPRLIHFAELNGFQTGSFPSEFASGIPATGHIYAELSALRRAIRQMTFPAIDWLDAVEMLDDPNGLLVSFHEQFRTKNGPATSEHRYNSIDFLDLASAPHLYAKREGRKFILAYDPKFMTTSTATVEFRAGRVRVSGFAIIKKIEPSGIWATPLFIGLTTSPEGRALMAALSQNPRD